MTTGTAKLVGREGITSVRACGPPVDTPMATISIGAWLCNACMRLTISSAPDSDACDTVERDSVGIRGWSYAQTTPCLVVLSWSCWPLWGCPGTAPPGVAARSPSAPVLLPCYEIVH